MPMLMPMLVVVVAEGANDEVDADFQLITASLALWGSDWSWGEGEGEGEGKG
ncbi:GL10636 [Drosophila persimilis]|uniref:GL10636 n=1 Tax=Drosophila persimilis TaxID=7234 RepID=B4GAW4_DROPE|nr:GL10636 [Drosophila persimilis]